MCPCITYALKYPYIYESEIITLKILFFDLTFYYNHLGASQVAQMVKNPHANAGDAGLIPGSGRSPGGGNGKVFLPGKFHGRRSLVDYSPWGLKE